MGLLVTVAGAVGGIGTSTFAWAVAQKLRVGRPGLQAVVLIDVQADGAPLDLIVGAERVSGVRWSQVRVRTTDIAANTVVEALPAHCGVSVLSADRTSTADPVALSHLVTVLRGEQIGIVLDLPARHSLRETARPDLDVLLVPPTMAGVVAARPALHQATEIVLADGGRAEIAPDMVGEHLQRKLMGHVRWQRSVQVAATAGVALPSGCDVMQTAARLLEIAKADV